MPIFENMTVTDDGIKLIAVVIICILLFLFFSVIGDEDKPIDNNFMKYLKNHASGVLLRDIYLDKDFIIIEESFFGLSGNYELSDLKRIFLIESSVSNNIVIHTDSIYGNRYKKLVEYCRSLDLPICRIVDLKPSNLVINQKTLDDGSTIYYYTRGK